MGASVQVIGLDVLIRKLNPVRLAGGPARSYLKRTTKRVLERAKANVSVDMGDLRDSLKAEIDPAPLPLWGRVGSDLDYARYVHDGTRPHWPPMAAVAPWADRHGIPAFLVARNISRVGTKPNPFLENAGNQSRGAISGYVTQMARDIETGAAV